MQGSYQPGNIDGAKISRTLLLMGVVFLTGCTRLTVTSTTTPTYAVDPSLFPSATQFRPTTLPTSSPSPTLPAAAQTPTVAADRQEDRIVLSFSRAGHDHLYAYQPLVSPFVQLTTGEYDDRDPAVSPDGTSVAFSSNRSGNWELYLLDLASGSTNPLTNTPGYEGAPSWSPDGQWLTYETYNGTNFDLVVMPVRDKTAAAVQLTQDTGNNFSPRWSPAGREIAFVSDRSGSNEIWIARLDVVDGRFVKLLGAPGASYASPAWSPDGSSLAWSKTVKGTTTVETASISSGLGDFRSYGNGFTPVWSQDGSALLVQLPDPQAGYLVAYRVSDGVLLFPAQYFPSTLHGLDWRTATLVNTLPAAEDQPALQPEIPLWQDESTLVVGTADRVILAPVADLKAPYSYFHPAAVEPFQSLRAAARNQLGWDFLGTLDDAVLPLSAPPQPGISENWLYTGRAFNFNSAPLASDWVTVTREDYSGAVYWRVWVRCANQDGSCGEPIRTPVWDFSARYQREGSAYEEGGQLGTLPTGYWLDFTRLATSFGFERPAALSNWRSYFPASLYNQFIYRQGYSWNNALLQLYPADALSGLAADTPLPIQP